ncbi:MAG: GAF domain-containing sensor histidine kinase [Phycisphaerae bacterium]|nr:GAF domain-containing sensor histidine kinase [Phycisphaerae bacterium]
MTSDASAPAGKRALPIPDGQDARQALRAHETLFDLYDRMIGDVDLSSVLRDITDVVCGDLNAQRATVYMVNRETHELESIAVIGNVPKVIRVPISPRSLAGFCAVSGRSFVVPDAYDDLSAVDPNLRFDRRWDEASGFRTRDVMCAPATFKGDVVGVVQVINHKGAPFSEDDLLPLRSIARLIGYSLYHARLFDDLATMKRLEKEKAQFMRVMVHELKSPAAAAKMMTDLLNFHPIENPKVRSLHERIAGRMDEMIELIQDILMLAKMKSGEPMGDIAVLNLVEELDQCCRRHAEEAQCKGLAFEVLLPDAPLPVRIDSQACRLVLSNLISNGVKYTPAGSVQVSLQPESSWAVLHVRDTGIGIPEKDIPKLFREFFRASNAKNSSIRGSGVGLAGVKEIVERFGGELALRSVENEGSTFTVRLPLHDPNATA